MVRDFLATKENIEMMDHPCPLQSGPGPLRFLLVSQAEDQAGGGVSQRGDRQGPGA